MTQYEIKQNPLGKAIYRVTNDQRAYIPEDPQNPDYQDYLRWIAEGNTPDLSQINPPPESGPTLEERLTAAETLINLILDEEEA